MTRYPRVIVNCPAGHEYSYPSHDPNALGGPVYGLIVVCDYCITNPNDWRRHRYHGWYRKLRVRIAFALRCLADRLEP